MSWINNCGLISNDLDAEYMQLGFESYPPRDLLEFLTGRLSAGLNAKHQNRKSIDYPSLDEHDLVHG